MSHDEVGFNFMKSKGKGKIVPCAMKT